MRFQLNTVMHEIAFVPGMTNFIDLEVARDQDRNIPFDAAARVMRQATPRHGSLDRQEARGGGRREASQATGANLEPLGAPRVRASRSFDRNVSRNRRASDSGSRAGRRTRRRHLWVSKWPARNVSIVYYYECLFLFFIAVYTPSVHELETRSAITLPDSTYLTWNLTLADRETNDANIMNVYKYECCSVTRVWGLQYLS